MSLWLTDAQQASVLNAVRPLHQFQRDALLQELAAQFSSRTEVGDGELARALRDLQRRHFDPPIVGAAPKHGGTV